MFLSFLKTIVNKDTLQDRYATSRTFLIPLYGHAFPVSTTSPRGLNYCHAFQGDMALFLSAVT